MSLPLVFDIALGLIFIYLIASLLASEIQELITTLFQWRAEHLKRSIETLISGNNRDSSYQRFVDRLYHSPLIRSLNQEARGIFAASFRRVGQAIGDAYRAVTRTRNVFGADRSGPSYLPASAFAAALLQQFQLEPLLQALQDRAIADFIGEKLSAIEAVLESLRNSVGDDVLLETEFATLQQNLRALATNARRADNSPNLVQSRLDAVTAQMTQFIDNTDALLQIDDHPQAIIRQRLAFLRSEIGLHQPMPSIADAVAVILDPTQRANLPPQAAQVLEAIHQANPIIPEPLRESLSALAKQAIAKAESAEAGLLNLQKEVEIWFDQSMERASGVYRRNARGVAILIGFALAIATNADTFHMVNRLSKDTLLRSTVTQAADRVASQTAANPDAIASDLKTVRDAVDQNLNGLLLPIGWDQTNVRQQAGKGGIIPFLRRILGWFVSGLAISMGANFWYNVLGRLIQVRNTGRSRSTSEPD